MTAPLQWLTNDPSIAKRLRAIDRAHARDRKKASNWSLHEKVNWYAKCDKRRDDAYARIVKVTSQ